MPDASIKNGVRRIIAPDLFSALLGSHSDPEAAFREYRIQIRKLSLSKTGIWLIGAGTVMVLPPWKVSPVQ